MLFFCRSLQVRLGPPQLFQRKTFELRGCEHVTPSLIQLHWLPVRWRIYFKLCTIMHAVHTGRCPAYLQEIVHTVSSTPPHPIVLSAAQQHVLDYARQCQPTTSFHDYVWSLANAPSPTPVQSHEILFQYTSEKRWTFIVLKDFSRLTLLV